MKKKSTSPAGFLGLRAITILFCAGAACSILTVPLLAFLHPQGQANGAQRALSFEERVSYQKAIEDVYWRHRIWPNERRDPKPSLDAMMSQAQLEKKVADYLRNSQALEDYWQHPITAEQLQAEMDRMAKNTKQPEVLQELFQALGNDPLVIAECLARAALAERLVTSWYAHDQRIHGELKQRAQIELQAHSSIEHMKQLSGKYSEIEFVKSEGSKRDEHRGNERGVRLTNQEWDQTVQNLTAIFDNATVAAGVSPAKPIALQSTLLPPQIPQTGTDLITQIKPGVISPLQEGEDRFYATTVVEKTKDRLKLATVAWPKEPLESWLAKAENQVPVAIAVPGGGYTLPGILGGGCTNDTWTATAGPPDVRYGHTAVWTGSEMIIWGGLYGYYPYFYFRNTGARYNPSTDTWTTTSTTNASTGRAGHTAVWNGTEMIIWGGEDGFYTVTNTGGRYNPSTNSWVSTSVTNAPNPRSNHTAVWTGNEMIVWGGTGATYFNNTGGRYNPVTNSWAATTTGNAPAGRIANTSAWTGTEMVVWGGRDINSQYFNTGGKYNPGTNSWTATSTANAPTGRDSHTTVWTGTQMIIWGGFGESFNTNTGGRYDPGTNSWTATSTTNAPDSRSGHTAVWTGNEMIVWGGGGDSSALNSGGRYNPSTNSWTNTNKYDAPEARDLHTSVWTGTEMIVWGGSGYPNTFNTGGRYDPVTNNWIATSVISAPSARAGHTAVWTGKEMIIWGGQDENSDELGTGGRYNPGTNDWAATSTSNAPTPRQWHTATWTGSEMIVWGGSEGFDDLNTGGRYDPQTDTWAVASTTGAPFPRDTHTAIWTGSEMIVWGGWNIDAQSYLNSGGKYDPTTNSWTATETTNAPEGRASHTAAWTGSEMIVWGGSDFVALNTGGRYDPVADTWTATNTVNAPDARFYHTAIWTGDEMIVWGGAYLDNNQFLIALNTGGRYDSATDDWIAMSLANAPDPRWSHTAVWTGNEMIVWGGGTLNTGGRYCAQSGPPPTPTPTPRVTPRPRPTPHARPSPR